MIECKYKTEPTKWFFTPDPYTYQDDLSVNSFFHPIDAFARQPFIFNYPPYDNVIEESPGPCCLKGIEIFNNQAIETNILKAIKQLPYAFVDKTVQPIDSQNSTNYFNKALPFEDQLFI